MNLSIEAPANFSREFVNFVLWKKEGNIESETDYRGAGDISTDIRHFVFRGLKPNTTYSFIVDTFRRANSERISLERSVSTPPECE